jgi:hypothetical protein
LACGSVMRSTYDSKTTLNNSESLNPEHKVQSTKETLNTTEPYTIYRLKSIQSFTPNTREKRHHPFVVAKQAKFRGTHER